MIDPADLALIGTAATVVSALATLALTLIAWYQLGAIVKQTRIQGERERKWRTLEICSRYDNDPILEVTTQRIWDQSRGGTVYDDMVPVRRDIINMLNFLDSIAIGISQGFYVEEVARDHLYSIVLKAVREFLTESRARELGLNLDDFSHLAALAAKWKQKPNYRGGV